MPPLLSGIRDSHDLFYPPETGDDLFLLISSPLNITFYPPKQVMTFFAQTHVLKDPFVLDQRFWCLEKNLHLKMPPLKKCRPGRSASPLPLATLLVTRVRRNTVNSFLGLVTA